MRKIFLTIDINYTEDIIDLHTMTLEDTGEEVSRSRVPLNIENFRSLENKEWFYFEYKRFKNFFYDEKTKSQAPEDFYNKLKTNLEEFDSQLSDSERLLLEIS